MDYYLASNAKGRLHPRSRIAWNDRIWREATGQVISLWKLQIGFVEKPICVRPFFLADYSIGISTFPLDLADYLANPSKYQKEDQEEFSRDVERWKNDGNFVFYWSESYHLDKNGDSL
jgi:hypothetical protein